MESSTLRALSDKVYEKRKSAALDLERFVRETVAADDGKKVYTIIGQLLELGTSTNTNSRAGSIMGLAGTSIALGPKIAEHLGTIVPPVLASFNDPDSKVRYFACESMYNIAKVAKGEILIFFNELFDAMSKLAADTEMSVKNGAELLDRLLKDIVTEQASSYVSYVNYRPETFDELALHFQAAHSMDQSFEKRQAGDKAFSLARFVPLLSERIYVLNPFTRTYLVSWLTVLDSVPELELVSYLPEFLDGLLKFLGDPTPDIRTATQNVLADFLREIRDIAEVQKAREDVWRQKEHDKNAVETANGTEPEGAPDDEVGDEQTDEQSAMQDNRRPSQAASDRAETGLARSRLSLQPERDHLDETETANDEDAEDYVDDEGSGEWIPGQGVHVDHAAIVEILLDLLGYPDEEIQSTCLRWISEFLLFVQPVMVPFTPRLIPVILSSLAHHVAPIRLAANDTNYNLLGVIQAIPAPVEPPPTPAGHHLSPLPAVTQSKLLETNRGRAIGSSPPMASVPFPTTAARMPSTDRASAVKATAAESLVSPVTSRFETSVGIVDVPDGERSRSSFSAEYGPSEADPFDYGATVNALTLQFLNEHEETRVAALEWLLMLHQKAPKKILAIDDPSGEQTRSRSRARQAYEQSESGLSIALLLKMLSDPSERVLRYDLQLLAQISSTAEDDYFPSFMMSLLSLFSTDRRLLETRGSLIVRQLCSSLNTERIYRTFAEILEKDEDLEFASIMVQNLNLIMITSPELAEFRKRLRTLDSKDGQVLFTVLYRSWSHNAVATFSLCLLAQAYEQASALLQIFAELEITVGLLIQIDKLVQLLESPVFTALRLQLLEPEKYPYLLKAMYGLLMLLPQSSAFATLRNRLSAVSSLGFLQTVSRSHTSSSTLPSTATGRSTIASTGQRRVEGGEIRWNELLTHFRQVQKRRASATASLGGEAAMETVNVGQQATAAPVLGSGFSSSSTVGTTTTGKGVGPGAARRRVGVAPAPSLGLRTDSASTVRGASGASSSRFATVNNGTATGIGSTTASSLDSGASLTRPTSPTVTAKRKVGSSSTGRR